MPAPSSTRRWPIVLLVVVLAVAGIGGGSYYFWTMSRAEARKELVGTWEVKFSKEIVLFPDQTPVIIITEDTVSQATLVRESGKTRVENQKEWFRYTVDPGQKPKTIDATFLTGSWKGKMVPGIYQIGEKTLSIVFYQEPDKNGRPEKIENHADHMVISLLRPR